jgi:hypothetical protein
MLAPPRGALKNPTSNGKAEQAMQHTPRASRVCFFPAILRQLELLIDFNSYSFAGSGRPCVRNAHRCISEQLGRLLGPTAKTGRRRLSDQSNPEYSRLRACAGSTPPIPGNISIRKPASPAETTGPLFCLTKHRHGVGCRHIDAAVCLHRRDERIAGAVEPLSGIR